jgi:transcriptional regulator with XRE-family HTH domain
MIGNTLKEILKEENTNVNELANKIGVSNQTLYSIIKRDNAKVDFELLIKICDTLNVSIDRFYYGCTSNTPNNIVIKLKEMKKTSKKTSRQISYETNIPKSTIDKLFSGQTKEPYLNSTRTIVNCLGFTLNDLFESDISSIDLTEKEKQIILAYRNKTNMQDAIEKLLDIN